MKHEWFSKIKKNNRGSGVVTVLLAVVFLSAFGTLLLILSYTGFEMRASDRKGKKNLYDASAIMEQMSAGLQEVCSDALVDAYGNSFLYYSSSGSSLSSAFKQQFVSAVKSWTGDYIGSDGNLHTKTNTSDYVPAQGKLLNEVTGQKWKYNTRVLQAMIVDYLGANVSDVKIKALDGSVEKEQGTAEIGDDYIVLKDVVVSFLKNGRLSRLVTDVRLKSPSIRYTSTSHQSNGVNSFACIANGRLIQSEGSGEAVINGDAYFGGVALESGGLQMRFTGDGNVVIGPNDFNKNNDGKITVSGADANRFVFESGTLWAKDINVELGTVRLNGDINVANNLQLSGVDNDFSSSAYLGGSYFGFGCPDPLKESEKYDPDKYSAIVVNGKRRANHPSTLDMTDLESLTLAGYAFIKSDNYSMAESVSAKENQKIYQIPAQLIYYVYQGKSYQLATNPEKMNYDVYNAVVNGEENGYPEDGFFFHDNIELWGKKKLSDYGAVRAISQYERLQTGNKGMVYVYAQFDTQDHANEFFKDYLKYNPEKVEKLIDYYVKYEGKPSSSTVAGGYVLGYELDDHDKKVPNDVTPVAVAEYASLRDSAILKQEEYKALTQSLNMPVSDDKEVDDPVSVILNKDKKKEMIKDNTHYICFWQDNDTSDNIPAKVVAVVALGNVTIEETEVAGVKKKVIKVDGEVVNDGSPSSPSSVSPDDVSIIVQYSRYDPDPSICAEGYTQATESVTVNGMKKTENDNSYGINYNGLLICEGDLVLKGAVSLNLQPEQVGIAMNAVSKDGQAINEFFDTESGSDNGSDEKWALNELVTYSNWKIDNDYEE